MIFEITPSSCSLKETRQKGQQLAWRRYDGPDEPKFPVTNIAVAFLRSEPTGEVKMTFAGRISSSGFSTVDEVKLNVIVRTKGGASIYSWIPVILAKCGDKNQPLVPPPIRCRRTSPLMSSPMSALSRLRNTGIQFFLA
jgi:hypothetical protein